jgi:hypothetical protein
MLQSDREIERQSGERRLDVERLGERGVAAEKEEKEKQGKSAHGDKDEG